jgi:hypothetical protein
LRSLCDGDHKSALSTGELGRAGTDARPNGVQNVNDDCGCEPAHQSDCRGSDGGNRESSLRVPSTKAPPRWPPRRGFAIEHSRGRRRRGRKFLRFLWRVHAKLGANRTTTSTCGYKRPLSFESYSISAKVTNRAAVLSPHASQPANRRIGGPARSPACNR